MLGITQILMLCQDIENKLYGLTLNTPRGNLLKVSKIFQLNIAEIIEGVCCSKEDFCNQEPAFSSVQDRYKDTKI